MVKFDQATLRDGRLEVSGPLDDPERVKHLIFMVVQGDVPVDDHAKDWSEGSWRGDVGADRLRPGPAQAVGVAVMLGEGAPPTYETFTWAQEITITQS